jgi:hypothetical protein
VTNTINCEVCGEARGKRSYKIHIVSFDALFLSVLSIKNKCQS